MSPNPIVAELLIDARAMIGEGPVWDEARQRLLWVDIPHGRVHSFEPRSGASAAMDLGQPVGSVAVAGDGGLVAALRDGFGFVAPGGSAIAELIAVEKDKPANCMNDGKCDCRGRYWAGTMADDFTRGAGTLYRLARGQSGIAVAPMLGDITVSNGIDWSLDNTHMYYIDSATRRIDVFDFDADGGTLRARRPLVEISDGWPDGMTVDAEGCLWVALFRAGTVRRYTPRGRIDAEIRVPVSLVTSCAFGGPGLQDLYITTARQFLTAEEAAAQTSAGGVFVCRPGPVGRPPFAFRR